MTPPTGASPPDRARGHDPRDRTRGHGSHGRTPGSAARLRRTLVIAFFLVYAIAVTFPGVVPFNRIFPLVLGLPFVLAWYAGWVVLGGVVLVVYHAAEGAD